MMARVVGDLATEGPPSQPSHDPANATLLQVLDGSSLLLAPSPSTAYHTSPAAAAAPHYSPQQVAAVLALMVGIWEVALGLLQLGQVFTLVLSDMLISGFTTGVAFQVLTSQVKYLVGVNVPRYSGPFKAIYTYIDLFRDALTANAAAVMVSAGCIGLLVANNEILKPRVRKVTRLPVPIELLVVVAGTILSYLVDLEHQYQVRVVGHIPTGLPAPSPPPVELVPLVAVDGFIIGIIGYTSTFSMAKIFAKRQGYTVDAEQELYAQGLSNVFGSFFSCGPMAASLSRSLIQEAVGGVTLLTSLISCVFLLFVLLFIGPVFEPLPNCVLSSVIVVALKGLFLQVHDLTRLWSSSRPDALIWFSTFAVSAVVDLDYGLAAGVLASAVVLLLRSQEPPTANLGQVPLTDLYLDHDKYGKAVEVPEVKIFHFGGPLHFGNASYFRSQLFSKTTIDLADLTAARTLPPQPHPTTNNDKQFKSIEEPASTITTAQSVTSQEHDAETAVVAFPSTQAKPSQDAPSVKQTKGEALSNATQEVPLRRDASNNIHSFDAVTEVSHGGLPSNHMSSTCVITPAVRWLVLDLSAVSFVDSMGAHLLTQLHQDLHQAGVTLCLAAASDRVLGTLESCGTFEKISRDLTFHSTHDAVTVITRLQEHPAASTRL